MILEEFDENKNSTFNPNDIEKAIPNFPKIGITCFSKKIIDRIVALFDCEKIASSNNANGKEIIYKIIYKEKEIAVFMSRVGAPACVVALEEIFAMGLEKLIVFGTCGVLENSIDDLSIVIPTSAVRDEGTSYHYIKANQDIDINKYHKEEFINILNEHNCNYVEGKVWTIDAPYRETKDKVLNRKKQGCICVDMECSAIFAMSNYRQKDVFQFFYAADNLDNSTWDVRSLGNDEKLSEKEKITILALELAIRM